MKDQRDSSNTEELICVCPDREDYGKQEKQMLSPKKEGRILGLKYLKRTTETVLDEGYPDSQEFRRDPQADPEIEVNATGRG